MNNNIKRLKQNSDKRVILVQKELNKDLNKLKKDFIIAVILFGICLLCILIGTYIKFR